jgi:uncharacterized protein (DUF934 family)
MAIVKNGLVVEDIWQPLGGRDPNAIDPATALIVSLTELDDHRDMLADFPRLGLALAPADDVREIANDLAGLELLAITFPKFSDGRAFSQARLLREAHGFTGEIRATGHILRDQLNFLRRSGVDAVEVSKDAEAWAKAWDAEAARFGGYYQPALNGKSNGPPVAAPVAGPLRGWAHPVAVGGLAAGAMAIHEANCAGAWAY